MIKNNVLSDRLNSFKNGELPDSSTEYLEQIDSVKDKIGTAVRLGQSIIEIFVMFLQSTAYGFALKTLLSTDWNFIEFLAIGFAIETLTSSIFNLFYKDK